MASRLLLRRRPKAALFGLWPVHLAQADQLVDKFALSLLLGHAMHRRVFNILLRVIFILPKQSDFRIIVILLPGRFWRGTALHRLARRWLRPPARRPAIRLECIARRRTLLPTIEHLVQGTSLRRSRAASPEQQVLLHDF